MWLLILCCLGVCEACGRAEYKTGSECCPMCSPGHCVYRHCTEFTSTTCVPCLPLTFTDKPHGQVKCQTCSTCDTGLRVKRECSSTSDTLCEPLEGHYCTDPIKDGCRGAMEHTKCKPGQFIKQQGTAATDTVCEDCSNNTYSDGTLTSCRPHTQCEPWGHWTVKAGTRAHDAKCRDAPTSPLLMAGLSLVALAGITLALVLIYKQRTSSGVADGLCWTPGHNQKGCFKHINDSETVDGLSWKSVKMPQEEEC